MLCLAAVPLAIIYLALAAIARAEVSRLLDTYGTEDSATFTSAENSFFYFKSRPDLQAPRFNVNVYEPEQIAGGFWFVAPYERFFRSKPLPGWVGAHIYDNNGGLVWSGASQFPMSEAVDFRVSRYRGQDVLTFVQNIESSSLFLNQHYEVIKSVRIAHDSGTLNRHEFNLVEDGTRALVLSRRFRKIQIHETGQEPIMCRVTDDGFRELDLTTEEPWMVREWHALDNIHTSESTFGKDVMKELCEKNYDFVHLNSMDVCPDGDYLLSARHADTIYKISRTGGTIVWRIGGLGSDFAADFTFTRQHDVRCLEQENGRTRISFLDNAGSLDGRNASNSYSRGLIVDLKTNVEPMTMEIVREYRHPRLGYAPNRGSVQVLPNGNVFMGWGMHALTSEYSEDGSLLMDASLIAAHLSSYRSYKFAFVGLPTAFPDVYAVASNRTEDGVVTPDVVTRVYVSWNGATEVRAWNLYESDSSAVRKDLVISAPRQGFETKIDHYGNPRYVVLEAIDQHGTPLENGRSRVITVIQPGEWTEEHPRPVAATSPQADEVKSEPGQDMFAQVGGEESMATSPTAASTAGKEESIVSSLVAAQAPKTFLDLPKVPPSVRELTLPILSFVAGLATAALCLLISKLCRHPRRLSSSWWSASRGHKATPRDDTLASEERAVLVDRFPEPWMSDSPRAPGHRKRTSSAAVWHQSTRPVVHSP